MADRHYLHGDYLEESDRNPTSTVYCGICDGYCLPQHLYDEHDIDVSVQRLKANKKVFYRTNRAGGRPENAPNYFEGGAETP